MSNEPTNRNGYPLADDLRETMASALGMDVDEGWLSIAITLMEQCTVEDRGRRSWSLPAEPGLEVTAVRCVCCARTWRRERMGAGLRDWWRAGVMIRTWRSLVINHSAEMSPLTDATLVAASPVSDKEGSADG